MKALALAVLLAGCTDGGFALVAKVQSVPPSVDRVVAGGEDVTLAYDPNTQVSTYERRFASFDATSSLPDWQLSMEFWTGSSLVTSVVLHVDTCTKAPTSFPRGELSRETFQVTVFVGPALDGIECEGNGQDIIIAGSGMPTP